MAGHDRSKNSADQRERLSGYIPRLLELVNDLVLSVAAADHRILYLNKSAETIYGRSLTELRQNAKLWFEAVHQGDQAKLQQRLQESAKSKRFEMDFRIVQPGGAIRYMQGSFRSVTDDQGTQVAIGCIAKDVTNRIHAEIELEESKAIYHSLVESLPINVFRKDREGRLVFVNNKCCQTYGRKREELLGKRDEELFDKELADKYKRDDRWVLQTGLPFHDIEYHPQEDEKYIYVEILKAPVTAANGRRIGIQGMFWDVTDRKKAELAMERARDIAEAASQAKSDFLANVSHEIRTPLNAVIGMTDLLLGTSVEKSQREYLNMIHDSGQSLLQLINDILDFSKIESGKITLHNEWFDLRERVSDSLRSLTHKAHAKGVELICNIDSRIPLQLLGDVQRLRQILLNLVGNSIKFTEAGEVQVDIELQHQEVELVRIKFAIRDSGIGIPEDKLAAIFDEFVQVDSSATRNFGGTGLGLAITSQLVELMGGKLDVSSQIGKGSQFFFSLEFVVGNNPAVPQPPQELRQKAALVIAHHEGVRDSFENVLRAWDMTVFSFDSTSQALQLLSGMEFSDQPIAAVLVDAKRISEGEFQSKALEQLPFDMPPIIEIAQTLSKQDTRLSEKSVVSRRIFHPVKYSELSQTLLHCVLPVDEIDTEEATIQAAAESCYRILVAEDNPVNQKLVLGILSKQKHQIVVVDNGLEAVDAVQHRQFDVVLMDVQMPEMDGLEATRNIRKLAHPLKSSVPVLALTAHALVSDRQRCLEAGMDDYLSKPFKASDLIAKIESLVENQSSDRAVINSAGGTNRNGIVDWAQAFDTVGGDRQLLCELIEVFLRERDGLVSNLAVAIDESNEGAIRRCAHTIKGTMNHLGAWQCAEIAWSIEESCAASTDEIQTKYAKLKRTLTDLTLELERFRNGHQDSS